MSEDFLTDPSFTLVPSRNGEMCPLPPECYRFSSQATEHGRLWFSVTPLSPPQEAGLVGAPTAPSLCIGSALPPSVFLTVTPTLYSESVSFFKPQAPERVREAPAFRYHVSAAVRSLPRASASSLCTAGTSLHLPPRLTQIHRQLTSSSFQQHMTQDFRA